MVPYRIAFGVHLKLWSAPFFIDLLVDLYFVRPAPPTIPRSTGAGAGVGAEKSLCCACATQVADIVINFITAYWDDGGALVYDRRYTPTRTAPAYTHSMHPTKRGVDTCRPALPVRCVVHIQRVSLQGGGGLR